MNIDPMAAREQLKEFGLAAWLCRKTGIKPVEMHKIWVGTRNPTPRQAIVLEGLFAKKRIPLDKVALVFGRDPKFETVDIHQLLERKLEEMENEKYK